MTPAAPRVEIMPLLALADAPRPVAPTVASGAGASLPNRSIDRLVEQWIAAIDEACLRDLARSKIFLRSSAGDLPGNEKAATRWAARFRAACGRALLSTFRTRFHRGAGSFFFDVVGRQSLETPMADTIGVFRWAFHSYGAGRKSKPESKGEVARVSASALADLIRIGGALKHPDVLDAISSIWREIAIIAAVTRERRVVQEGDRWAFQVRLPLTNEPVIIGVAGPRNSEHEQMFDIRSIRRRSNFDPGHLAPIDALDRALAAEPQKIFGVIDDPPENILELIDGVRNLGSGR